MATSGFCVVALIAATASALNLTATEQHTNSGFFGGGPLVGGPCFNATDPKLWPAKPESHVCGTDGLLYPSKSVLECAQIMKGHPTFTNPTPRTTVTVQSRDKCGSEAKSYDTCPLARFAPFNQVCGTDNVTYDNVLDMACSASKNSVEISLQSVGECKIDCPYSPIYKPVCGSLNDETFANEEALKCKQMKKPYSNLQLKHLGKCTNDPQKYPCLYDDFSFGTVCASNGRSYTTSREIRCLKESNPALEVLHDGACTVQEVEKIIGLDDVCKMAMHTFEANPLCGSDNVTYSNAYTFLCAAKNSPKDKR